MKQQVDILIRGNAGCGKSLVANIIEKALKSSGYKVIRRFGYTKLSTEKAKIPTEGLTVWEP